MSQEKIGTEINKGIMLYTMENIQVSKRKNMKKELFPPDIARYE